MESETLGNQVPGEQIISQLQSAALSLENGEVLSSAYVKELLGTAALTIAEYGEMAFTDHLTGIASSRYFDTFIVPKLTRFCAGERRKGGPDTYMIGIADVNGLKQVNETLGYDAGDALICAAATRIKQLLRAEDIVTRHGDRADEFIVIMPVDGFKESFSIIADVIARRINSDGLSMALGFVSLDEFSNLDSAFAAAQDAMAQNKLAIKSERKPI